MTEGGAMPKGWNESSPSSPSDSGSAGSSAPKSGNNKIGIGIAIGITAVALAIGIGFTGIIPMGEETPSVMQPAPSAPVVQHTEPVVQHTEPVVQQTQPSSPPAYVPMKSTPSYTPAGSDMIDQLDWSISEGDVKSMHIDKSSSA